MYSTELGARWTIVLRSSRRFSIVGLLLSSLKNQLSDTHARVQDEWSFSLIEQFQRYATLKPRRHAACRCNDKPQTPPRRSSFNCSCREPFALTSPIILHEFVAAPTSLRPLKRQTAQLQNCFVCDANLSAVFRRNSQLDACVPERHIERAAKFRSHFKTLTVIDRDCHAKNCRLFLALRNSLPQSFWFTL